MKFAIGTEVRLNSAMEQSLITEETASKLSSTIWGYSEQSNEPGFVILKDELFGLRYWHEDDLQRV